MNSGIVLALLLLLGGAIGSFATLAAAQLGGQGSSIPAPDGAQVGLTTGVSRSGSFHGFDAAHGAVWVDDYLYWLDPGFTVVGNSTKLGTLSAIKWGETIDFTAVPDPKDPRRTLILEIRRK